MSASWHKLFQRLQEMDGGVPVLYPCWNPEGDSYGKGKDVGAGFPRPSGPAIKFLLLPLASSLSALYGLGARTRRALYAQGWLKTKRLPAPVVSVGNLTVGGTGKTPMVACLARLLAEQGKKVAILSRGYGGRAKGVTRISDGNQIYARPPEVGEEAYFLARALPGVAVYTAPERYAAGLAAWRDFKPDLFLLDDGFQHFQLHRDLDVVLLDAEAPFGNGYLLPRGPLREPVSTLAAARVVILTRFNPDRHQDRLKFLKEKFPGKTVLTAAILPTRVFVFPEDRKMSLESLKNQTLLAFAGLARPRVFYDTLKDLGVILQGCRDFPDHYAFQNHDLDALIREAQSRGAGGLITTAKDWARLGEKWKFRIPLWVLEVEARLEAEGEERILEILGEGARGGNRPDTCATKLTHHKSHGNFLSDFSPKGLLNPPFLKGYLGGLSASYDNPPYPPLEKGGDNTGFTDSSPPGAAQNDKSESLAFLLPPEVKQRFQKLRVKGKWTGDPAAVRRILVRAPNWVGDAVMSLPTLAGVHALFPEAEITVLAAPRVAPLFTGIPGVAEVVPYLPGLEKWRTLWRLRCGQTLSGPGNTMQHIGPHNSPSPGGRGLGEGSRTAVSASIDSGRGGPPHRINFIPTPALPPQGGGRKDLKFSDSWDVAPDHENRKPKTENRPFDLGLALPNSWEAALGLWLAGAQTRLGYDTQGRGPLLNLAVSGLGGLAGLHTVYYLLGVLQGLGGAEFIVPPRLYLQEGEVAAAAVLLQNIQGEGPWVGLSPGAAFGPAKRWPPERFVALGAELRKEFGARLVLLGGPEDRDAAAAVKTRLPEALDLVGSTTLRQALGVLMHLKLLITNDSGLMHAAAALGTPLVAIFGSTDPVATGPFTDRATVLHHPLPCSPCFQRTCDREYQCLLDISVAEVMAGARVWLKES
ncbi:MAG: tetraacyldisaccharide 4'-kinase [Deltaproteobacteria bacterium]|nr:tetraacyldisaccharide 4'-kinase [Deltaproteobacteria bacterium]